MWKLPKWAISDNKKKCFVKDYWKVKTKIYENYPVNCWDSHPSKEEVTPYFALEILKKAFKFRRKNRKNTEEKVVLDVKTYENFLDGIIVYKPRHSMKWKLERKA